MQMIPGGGGGGAWLTAITGRPPSPQDRTFDGPAGNIEVRAVGHADTSSSSASSGCAFPIWCPFCISPLQASWGWGYEGRGGQSQLNKPSQRAPVPPASPQTQRGGVFIAIRAES